MSGTNTSGGSWPLSTWLSIISLGFGSFALVGSELLPAALLTPMARDFGVTEGAAGQAVTLTAIAAAIAAPTVALVIGRLDRKLISLMLCGLVVASNVTVTLTSDYLMLLAARAMLGISIGGFFALSGAIVVRLVSMEGLGKGMSIVFIGMSIAMVVAPALGALIGEALGWRAVFLAAAAAGTVAVLLQALYLPSVPETGATSLSTLFGLMGRSKVRIGLAVALLFFGGDIAGFTFIRPYLEAGAGFDATTVAIVLLVLGIANLIGNAVGGVLADRVLRAGFAVIALALAVGAVGLVMSGSGFVPALAFISILGFAAGAGPVMIQTWMGQAAPDQLEGVGGLVLAVAQLGLALGAIAGGIAVDFYGVDVPFYLTALCGVLSALLIATQRSSDMEREPSPASELAAGA